MKKMLKQQVMAALAVTALLGAVCPAVQAAATPGASVTPVGGETVTASEEAPVVTAEAGKTTLTGKLTGAVYGGGQAVAQTKDHVLPGNEEYKGYQASIKTAGADINLNGVDLTTNTTYTGGVRKEFNVLGGGYAEAFNFADASSEMTDTVNINIDGKDTQVSGVVGNGMAFFTGSADGGTNKLKGMATVSAVDTNINVKNGIVNGIIGGGIAIDDSQSNWTNASAKTTGTAAINVTGGTIGKLTLNGAVASDDVTKPDVNNGTYTDGIKAAAGSAAIVAGGIALGGGAVADVANAVVNINGGTVNGDIYGGGAAAYGWPSVGESYVENSTINLNGGTVTGNVYAGGAAATKNSNGTDVYGGYNAAMATVDKAVINLAGTKVDGILYGVGTVNAGTTSGGPLDNDASIDSTLNLIGTNKLGLTEKGESKIQSFDVVNFKAGSETVVTKADSTTALINGGKVNVEDGARLNLTELETGFENGAQTGKTYNIAANTTADSKFWNENGLVYDRTSVYATTNGTNGFEVTYNKIDAGNADKAADSMAAALGARSLLGMFREGMSNNWEGFGAAQTYLQDWSKAEDPTAGQKGMLIGEDAAVTGNTVSIARDMADNVMQRLSFTDDYVQDAGWVNENGGLWAKYIHRTYDTDGMGSSMGGIHSSTDYDGVIVGMDFGKSGKFQSGVAFHYGSGDGHGLVSRNDYDAWGITMYGSMKDEAAGTNLMADIGWMTSDNDIDGTVDGKSVSADRDVDAWTIGLRGEKEYAFGRNQLVPYVGLRYMSINPGRYTAYYDGKAAFNYDADNQNLWMLPIGVSFRNETVTAGGWRITPKVDLSYIWAFGDTDTDMTVTVNAGSASSTLYYDVMDDSSWLASLGVEASKDVWSFGVGYGYQKGDDEKNRTWFVNASYAF